jgi:hypothetical protein
VFLRSETRRFPRKLRAMTSKNAGWVRGALLAVPAGSLVVQLLATNVLADDISTKDAATKGVSTKGIVAADRGAKHRLPCPARVPDALNPPAESTIDLGLPAHGVQVYACTSAKPGEAPSWTLEAPHALLSSGEHLAAIHFAGPIWQGLDGSQVKGARLASAAAPTATDIPWLLLSAAPTGAGTFAQTTHIQRLDTVGGQAPSSGCDASHIGAKVLVPYRASYFFYRNAAAGETVRQCRSRPEKAKKS